MSKERVWPVYREGDMTEFRKWNAIPKRHVMVQHKIDLNIVILRRSYAEPKSYINFIKFTYNMC
jgi:hypothetical protein